MRLWPWRPPEIIHSPEVNYLGPIEDKEWEGLLLELTEGYEKHKPIFRALQILLRQAEREALRVHSHKTLDESSLWERERAGIIREANAYRRALRLPIEAAKLKAQREKRERTKAEEDDLDPEERAGLT